jgi:hypothetical protein
LYDGHEVLSEFVLWSAVRVVENDELSGTLRAEPFDEFEPESGEPVSRRHNNLSYRSCLDESQ